jgi:hypothetical protein
MENKKVAILYVYDYVTFSSYGLGGRHDINGIRAIVAPNDDFMTSILEKLNHLEGDHGDFKHFERTDGESGFDRWKLRNTLELTQEQLESLGMDLKDFKENINTPLNLFSIDVFGIEHFDEDTYDKLTNSHGKKT